MQPSSQYYEGPTLRLAMLILFGRKDGEDRPAAFREVGCSSDHDAHYRETPSQL